MKQKLVLLSICVCYMICAMAQQQGIVRTLERPGKPSTGIEGVSINVLEYANSIVSKKGGKFSFTIHGKRQGDSFTVTRVQKKGYILVDKQLKGRRFAYSSSVPLEIVMITNQQLENDKKQIEDKAYGRAKRDYDQKLATLQHQLKMTSISEQEYRAKYEELNANYNSYIQLIDEMAERYALTDYKGMSDKNKEIQASIEDADLEHADSLINAKGGFDKREQELRDKRELMEKSEHLSQQLKKDIEIETEDLMRDYSNKLTINTANYRNDSAAYYLERIVALDSTNGYLLFSAARFIDSYLTDYPLALSYYRRALGLIQEQYGEVSEESGQVSEFIGLTYDHLGDLNQSLEWHHKALDIFKQTVGLDNADAALVYTHIGRIYTKQDSTDKALEYTLKGLDIRKCAIEDQDDPCFSQSYNNLGVIYSMMGDNEKAMESHMKALEQRERVLGTNAEGTALSYLNIGALYSRIEDFDNSLIYLQKALDSYRAVFGPAHPNTIQTLQHMAAVYHHMQEYGKMMDCYREILSCCEKFYGPDHRQTQEYRNIVTKLEETLKQQ